MSVPLDRLYNFLQSVCNKDILIYRWTPHGSRKLADLRPLIDVDSRNIVPHFLVTIQPMICHDQEPLNYNYWTTEDFANLNRDFNLESASVAKQIAHWHLRSALYARNRAHIFGKTLLCHSELHSKELEKYEANGFEGVYYWSHAVIARDWYRFAAIDPNLNYKHLDKDFLIYNRAWSGTREYRLTFLEMLVNQNLIENCNVKFAPVDGYDYRSHKFVNPNLSIANKTLENFVPSNNSPAHSSADYNHEDYNSTAIEVVLETIFDDTRWHLTEKILRPIACGQPFILASTPGSLSYIKRYGFETFDTVFDESYDTISDPLYRLQAIAHLMKKIANHPDRASIYGRCNAIAKRNQQRFFSQHFHDQVILEFKQNFTQAYMRSYWGCNTDKMEEFLSIVKKANGYPKNLPPGFLALADFSRHQVNDFIEQAKNESNNRSSLVVEDFADNQ